MDSVEGQMNINAKGKFPIEEQLIKDMTVPHELFWKLYERKWICKYLFNKC